MNMGPVPWLYLASRSGSTFRYTRHMASPGCSPRTPGSGAKTSAQTSTAHTCVSTAGLQTLVIVLSKLFFLI